MATKKNTFIEVELSWAEEQLASWKKYIDDHPVKDLVHQTCGKTVITVQAQGKFIQETMKNYLALLAEVDKMREREESKDKEKRGGGDIPHRMKHGNNLQRTILQPNDTSEGD